MFILLRASLLLCFFTVEQPRLGVGDFIFLCDGRLYYTSHFRSFGIGIDVPIRASCPVLILIFSACGLYFV